MDGDEQIDAKQAERLRQAIRRLEKETIFVPGQIDDKVAQAARKQFGTDEAPTLPAAVSIHFEPLKIRPRAKTREVSVHRRVRRWHRWLPLAASIMIAAIILFFARPESARTSDLNGDGVVDVIDAMLLAQSVQNGNVQARWDVNRDGRVDRHDAEEILQETVDVERSGS